MKETQRHKDAFEYYYALGPTRTLRGMQQQYNENTTNGNKAPAFRTIAKWSTELGWQERIMLRDREIAKNVEKKIVKEEEDIRIAIYKKLKKEEQIYLVQEATAFYIDEDGKKQLKQECIPKASTDLSRIQEGKRKNLETQIRILAPDEGKGDLSEIKIVFEDIDSDGRKTRKKVNEVSNVSD